MEVVLRTPSGEAEISLGPMPDDATLADIVEQVSGRTPGEVVYVDGRAVRSAATLGTAGALNGSTIATVDDNVPVPTDARVELVQVAGRGAGARSWLSAGRYRIGVGRRASAPELSLAPVDTAMLELVVDDAGAVSVRAASMRARLDGVDLPTDDSTPWRAGYLDVAGRVFALGPAAPGSAPPRHRLGGVGVDGYVAFNRPPRPARAPAAAALVPPDASTAPTRGRSRRDGSAGTGRDAVEAFATSARRAHDDERDRRRASAPDLVAAASLAESASPELWQRRPGHEDAFQIAIGLADLDWSPTVVGGPSAAARAILEGLGPTPMVPLTVDLLGERGVGVVGATEFARAMLRGLLIEAVVAHGPADLDVVVLTAADRAHVWEWVKWLPHSQSGGEARIFWTEDHVAGWAAAVQRAWERPARPTSPSHLTIVVVDDPSWWRERTAPLRPLFSDPSVPLRFLVTSDVAAEVPAVCTTVVTAQAEDTASVDFLMDRRHVDGLRPFLASEELALRVARRLAPLDDPDVAVVAESQLPSAVPLLSLLGLDRPTVDQIVDAWSRRASRRLMATVGISDAGPLQLDLVDDGPHALVGGAAGAGVSELLCTVVAGLAAAQPPDIANVVLVTAAGGSGFEALAALPHTVGWANGIDSHLAARMLRCLRAELGHRDAVLQAAGAASIVEYDDLEGVPALPRLVVVVDDLTSLAQDQSDVISSLVDIGHRGQRVGVHLVLATQHASSVVDDEIRDGMNLRIALRVQDDGDSLDLIGTRDAAHVPRRVPGRGYLRLGSAAPALFQAASSTGVTIGADHANSESASLRADSRPSLLDIRPSVLARELSPMERRLLRYLPEGDADTARSPSDLERLVTAIGGAAEQLGQRSQRVVWPDPLPGQLPLETFFADHPGDAVPYALVDLPDEQRQEPAWWSPGPEGSLLVHGIDGSGTTSLLTTLAVGVASRMAPDDVHVYCIDADDGALSPLVGLAHVGAVVRLDELDRVARLAAHLTDVFDDRARLAAERGTSAVASTEPSIVLMIDDVGALRAALDARRDLDGVWADIERVVRDGGPVGMCSVVTAKQERDVPPSWPAHFSERLVMRLGDRSGYLAFGLRSTEIPPEFVPGRAVRLDDRAEMHAVAPPTSPAAIVARSADESATTRPVRTIDPLPATIALDTIIGSSARTPSGIVVPIGLDTRSGEVACATVPFGENVMVSGPPGSGRSSVLVAFAAAAGRVDPPVAVFAAALRGGPLASLSDVDRLDEHGDVDEWVARLEGSSGQRLVLVDDADRLDGTALERLAALRDGGLIVVAAGRGDDLRFAGHWTKPLQRSRYGVLLRPGPNDGDLVQTSIGPALPRFAPHRGILVVDGDQIPVLAATVLPPDRSREAEPE